MKPACTQRHPTHQRGRAEPMNPSLRHNTNRCMDAPARLRGAAGGQRARTPRWDAAPNQLIKPYKNHKRSGQRARPFILFPFVLHSVQYLHMAVQGRAPPGGRSSGHRRRGSSAHPVPTPPPRLPPPPFWGRGVRSAAAARSACGAGDGAGAPRLHRQGRGHLRGVAAAGHGGHRRLRRQEASGGEDLLHDAGCLCAAGT